MSEKERNEARQTAQNEKRKNVIRVNTAIIVCRTLREEGDTERLMNFKALVSRELSTLATADQVHHIMTI